MTVSRLGVLLLTAAMTAAATGQTRDTARGPETVPVGTATLGGVVVLNPDGQPVRRAAVRLFSSDLRVPVSTTTDDNGRFTFTGIAAGNYGIAASKAAYIGGFHGATQPGRGPGVPVAVRDGERVDGLTITIARGGVIAGTVLLPAGLPAEGMTVLVTGIDEVAGVRRSALRGGRSVTDDRGEYRVFGLGPGDYLVQVRPSGFIAGTPSGATDARQTSASEVRWAEAVARQVQGAALPDARAAGRTKYARVFHPGTTDASEARVVSLASGEERLGIDVAMTLVATARVTGTVVAPGGAPLAGAAVTLLPAGPGLDALADVAVHPVAETAEDGSFELSAIGPGRYRLSVRRSGDGAAFWADETMNVDGQDIEAVTVVAQPALSVSGRLRFEGGTLAPPGAAALDAARATLVPRIDALADPVPAAADALTAAVAPDGTFRFDGVVPGAYRIAFAMPGVRMEPDAPGDGWTLASVRAGAVDVLDDPLIVTAGGEVPVLDAVFTDRPSEFVGSLTDRAGRPAPHYPIVVFSTTPDHWTPDSRRVTVARPATDGGFRLVGLPAGRYYVVAVVSIDDMQLGDPAYLEQLASGALAVTLTAGTRTTQDLQLAGG